MPSGPPELHEKWETDGKAIRYLEACGYKLTKHFHWLLPDRNHRPTNEEQEAITYLIYEWDFGGILSFKGDPFVKDQEGPSR